MRVTAAIDVAKIEPGQIVRVQTRLNSRGAATGEVATLTVVDAASAEIGVAWDAEAPRTAKDMTACTVTAPVTRASRKRITDVSDREWAMIRDKLERMVGRLGAAIFHAVTLRRP